MPQIPQNINECDVITIFPMDVECVVIHPSTLNSSDGMASLSITGGTPPYNIIWENGSIGPAINNLSVGEYDATITDYYGDFTIQTTCVLTGDTDCSFEVSVENYLKPAVPNCFYTVTITGGTSVGPYTIYYDVVSNNNIAEIYSGGNANNLTLSVMESGVNITIPCSSKNVLIYNELCDTYITVPVTPNIPINDFCLTFIRGQQKQFTGDGYDSNGNPTWIDGDGCEVFWDTTIGEWKLSCLWGGYQLFSTDPVTSNPPINGWYDIGQSSTIYEVIANEGICQTGQTLTLLTTINQPSCECDGSITLVADGGTPPYQYSFNGGNTYGSSPLLNGACSNTYSVSVKDSDDNIVNSSVTVDAPQNTTEYTISFATTGGETSTNTFEYVTVLNIDPELPSGVEISIDVQHLGIFDRGGKTVPTLNRVVNLNKNNVVISPDSSQSDQSSLPPPNPSCPPSYTYLKDTTTNIWNNITIGSEDSLIINTTSTITNYDNPGLCIFATDTNTFSLSNPSISGCDCCDVLIDTSTTDITTLPPPEPCGNDEVYKDVSANRPYQIVKGNSNYYYVTMGTTGRKLGRYTITDTQVETVETFPFGISTGSMVYNPNNEKIYLLGQGITTGGLIIFDTSTDTWTNESGIPYNGHLSMLYNSNNNSVYILYDNDNVIIFDCAAETYTTESGVLTDGTYGVKGTQQAIYNPNENVIYYGVENSRYGIFNCTNNTSQIKYIASDVSSFSLDVDNNVLYIVTSSLLKKVNGSDPLNYEDLNSFGIVGDGQSVYNFNNNKIYATGFGTPVWVYDLDTDSVSSCTGFDISNRKMFGIVYDEVNDKIHTCDYGSGSYIGDVYIICPSD